MVRERFTSRVTLDPRQRIDVAYTEGPLRYLNNHWVFEPAPGGCVIDFFVDFEFKSAILQRLIGALFNEAVRRMVGAFETRAHALYGNGDSLPDRSAVPPGSWASSHARQDEGDRPALFGAGDSGEAA